MRFQLSKYVQVVQREKAATSFEVLWVKEGPGIVARTILNMDVAIRQSERCDNILCLKDTLKYVRGHA